jgi:hypothetical protein
MPELIHIPPQGCIGLMNSKFLPLFQAATDYGGFPDGFQGRDRIARTALAYKFNTTIPVPDDELHNGEQNAKLWTDYEINKMDAAENSEALWKLNRGTKAVRSTVCKVNVITTAKDPICTSCLGLLTDETFNGAVYKVGLSFGFA